MMRYRSYGILFVLALASTSATASADPPKDPPRPASTDGYSYTFTDDALLAGATGVLGVPIRSRLPGNRATLIRPRTAFIVELLKSVENL